MVQREKDLAIIDLEDLNAPEITVGLKQYENGDFASPVMRRILLNAAPSGTFSTLPDAGSISFAAWLPGTSAARRSPPSLRVCTKSS